jgi:DNA replication protein DnaC
LALGLAACQRGMAVGFAIAAGLVHQLMEARDEKRLLRLQAQLAAYKLLIIDELGYVPLSPSFCSRSSASVTSGARSS